MKSTQLIVIILLVILGLAVGLFVFQGKISTPTTPTPTPTPIPSQEAVQLPADQQPKISLTFTSDSHFATVNISNLSAASLEYNLIYDATVKGQKLQTGVNASQDITGKTSYSQKQLLGSESSGKFTYHTNIQNAFMELTLRDVANRSIFTATYPFMLAPGQTLELTASES